MSGQPDTKLSVLIDLLRNTGIPAFYCLCLLSSPLAAETVGRLVIEESTDLQEWDPVPVTPEMLDQNGNIRTPTDSEGRFYRLQLKLFSTPIGFSLIPAGPFTMGRTSGDSDSNAPPVTIFISDFYMGKWEVTKAEWNEVLVWAQNNGYSDLSEGSGKGLNHPVHTISWFDMVKWCNARSQKEGLTPVYTVAGEVMKTGTLEPSANWAANGYRLPTEAEWEKASRGGVSGQRFPWGNTITHSDANYSSSISDSYDLSPTRGYHPGFETGVTPYTSPVGSFTANGYGLYDMSGNIREWCWDWYSASTYSTGTTDPKGPATGPGRVLRGGGWGSNAFRSRSAHRNDSHPTNWSDQFGFRIARGLIP